VRKTNRSGAWLGSLGLLALVASFAQASRAEVQASAADGLAYPVSEFVIVYIDPNPAFPAPDAMTQVAVELTATESGYVTPRLSAPVSELSIASLTAGGARVFFESALRAINQQLVFEFNRRDFHAIVVSPLPEDIDRRTGRDLRPKGERKLRLGVYAGRVKDVHTVASARGEAAAEEITDLAEHAWIREGSPIQPTAPNDLVRKDALDEYLAQLNRHPSRRVDAELRPARSVGGVVVDYFVAENKPWWAYSQLDDTGTEQTAKLRQRLGFVHSNLSGRDDILQFDYITGNFDEVHAVAMSYEVPFDRVEGLKARVFGIWSQYDASLLAQNQQFSSDQVDVGAQLIGNLFQSGELFLDAFGGMQWQRIRVDSTTNLLGAVTEQFVLATLGARAERFTSESSLRAELSVIHNFASLAGTSDSSALGNLGRLPVNEADYSLIRWNSDFSFFVPAIFPKSWRDPAVPFASSLAHEVGLWFRGQRSLGDRLIPQQEYVAGGALSVRGYPESATAGDNVESVGFEYRLHVPRLLAPASEPVRLPGVGNFHARPKYAFTFPDWDFVVRAFVDYAHVSSESFKTATGFPPVVTSVSEPEVDLLGAGAGLELRFKRFVTARVDYGIALMDADLGSSGIYESGEDQVHFSVTLLY
jgi:hemolysin activation/secretion protein